MDYIEQEKESIIEELLNSGKVKPGQSINYQYFRELYEPHKEQMSEVEFAKMLGISYSNYMTIKHKGIKTKVLRERIEKISEEEKQEIIEELLNSGKIKPGQLINYESFIEIYESYKEKMTEVEFAELLGISYGNYMNIKHQGIKTKVLRERIEKISEEEKQEIIEELLNSGKVKPGQLINYESFIELYESYKEKMTEVEFAELLGISYGNYMNIKHQGIKTKVLRERIEKISEEEKQEIIEELLNSGKVKPGQSINYEYFKELYEPHKEQMAELEFAELLGISYRNYMNIKHRGIKTKVLRERIEKISEEEKQEIIEELLNSGKVKPGQSINYEYFKELYEPHKEQMAELEFAELLGISYRNYMNIKHRGIKTKVLRERIEKISEEEKQEIIEELLDRGKVKPGQSINYESFKELYEPYKEKMTEVEFAELLGISYSSYTTIKYQGTNAKVIHYKDKEKIDRIKYILKQESRYYSQEELVNLSKKYNCTIDTIILCLGMDGKYLDTYKETLEQTR